MTDFRVGDAERAQAVAQLEQHAAAGRLATAELDQRVAQARTATYETDLDTLFADLPGGRNTQEFHWAQMPTGPSGISDDDSGPASAPPNPGPTFSGPVYTGQVLGAPEDRRTRELQPGRIAPWSIVSAVIGLVVVLALMRYIGFGSLFFLWFFVLPALGRRGRGRWRR